MQLFGGFCNDAMDVLMSDTSRPSPSPPEPAPAYRAGPHWVAFFAAVVAWPLIITGGQVTSYRVGMAVPDWPTTFGINMFLYNFWKASWGVFIEHRHRLFGTALGLATIVLAVWFLLTERRKWMKGLGVAALVAVIVQGLLGATRVLQNSTQFAAIHACTGQAVFALLVALCVLTGRDWATGEPPLPDTHHIRRRALVTLGLIYGQIVAGAFLRHYGVGLAVHVVLALAVWGHAAMLAWRIEGQRSALRWLLPSSRALAFAVSFQVVLGVAAWLAVRPYEVVSTGQALVRTGHVANGALLLAASVVLALRSVRHLSSSPRTSAQLAGQGVGAALEMVA